MRLTWPLFLYKRPKGHLFRGKYRFVKRVTKGAMESLKCEYEQEEQNMFYLRHPYLTREETKCLREVEQKPFWAVEKWNERNAKFERKRTLADELSHLKVTQDWDFKGGYKFRKIQELGLVSTYKDKDDCVGIWLHHVFGLPLVDPSEVGDIYCEWILERPDNDARTSKFLEYCRIRNGGTEPASQQQAPPPFRDPTESIKA
ncbi:hypothetical protein GE061_019452 [Apolygus lucorum]|uniref:Ribosomal protein 63, mitochondrial n=1 Tax=Apolygus lucorum TaxID=248454 RepID=A0A8S9X8K2_APOLU|nr:hypothetical protein GE061_019452 [Apolygus lucorum]